MRGVGAKERAVGYAWGRLDSKQRARFGNQRNFASRLQDAADAQAEQRNAQTQQQALEKGRQIAREEAGGTTAPAAIPAGPVRVERAGQDRTDGLIRYDDNKPKPRRAQIDAADALRSAVEAGRIKMDGNPSPSHADNVIKSTQEEQGGLFRKARMRGQFNQGTVARIY
jgi:hypothetical protein